MIVSCFKLLVVSMFVASFTFAQKGVLISETWLLQAPSKFPDEKITLTPTTSESLLEGKTTYVFTKTGKVEETYHKPKEVPCYQGIPYLESGTWELKADALILELTYCGNTVTPKHYKVSYSYSLKKSSLTLTRVNLETKTPEKGCD